MATTRIKDISSTVTSLASDDYIPVDGATNGTRKMARSSIYADVAAAFTGAPTTYDICPLNSGTNKIDATYLPTSGDTPKGEWNASTNSPSLADGSGTAGDYYDVTTAGTQNLGSGNITFTVGDVVKYNGSTWYKIDSVANFLDGYSTAATSRTALEVNSVDEDAEANGTKLVGPALYFDGTNDYVEVADDAKLSFTDGTDDLPFSVSAWVNMTDATSFTVLSKIGAISTDREYEFGINGNDDLYLLTRDTSGNLTQIVSDTALTTHEGQWLHIAASYGGAGPTAASGAAFTANMSGGNAALFVNGAAVTSTASDNASYAGMSDTTQSLRIGRGNSTYAKGHIKDVKIFNRELSATEVAQLAKGNDLGFADEWGGALGGLWTSDFSAGVDGTTSVNGVLAGNIDSVGPVGDLRDDTLRFTANAGSSFKKIQKDNITTVGKRNRVTFDYYIPSGQSNIDGFAVSDGGVFISSAATRTLGAWTRFEVEYVGTYDDLHIWPTDGASTTYDDTGGDDVLYIRNVKVTEIGTLADFRVENFIADKLIDQSANNFVGTNNGATLVGGRKALQLDTDGAAAGNNVLSIYNGASHLAYVTDKGDLNANSISSGASTELTIATGAVTATKSYHTIDTESDAASDDLDTISGGRAGQILVVQANNSARSVVLKDGTGNLKLSGDITLDNAEDTATLVSDGTSWYLIATSNNGA